MSQVLCSVQELHFSCLIRFPVTFPVADFLENLITQRFVAAFLCLKSFYHGWHVLWDFLEVVNLKKKEKKNIWGTHLEEYGDHVNAPVLSHLPHAIMDSIEMPFESHLLLAKWTPRHVAKMVPESLYIAFANGSRSFSAKELSFQTMFSVYSFVSKLCWHLLQTLSDINRKDVFYISRERAPLHAGSISSTID